MIVFYELSVGPVKFYLVGKCEQLQMLIGVIVSFIDGYLNDKFPWCQGFVFRCVTSEMLRGHI